ncbi:MAG: hypothetical protein PHC34_01040 [Candidatus Gastranaerophilales bacterium]|nr:hypothetical protein [Candidatus Gastranaerophilales bacterium]
MKNLFKIFFATIIFFNIIHAACANSTDKIAVFPVDIASQGANISVYPVTIGMIANDLANSLTTRYNINTIDISSSRNLIKSAGLTNTYRKMIENFQNTYTIDYNSCQIIADKIGANKILLVSGGYDIQNMILEPGNLTALSIPGLQTVKPSYKLYIMLTLIDPQSGTVLWENTYKKNITGATMPTPSIYFGDNVSQTNKVKSFSYEISKKASATLAGTLLQSGYTQVNSHIISTSDQNFQNKPKDGITTMDGHFYSTNDDYLRVNRKENFKNWVKGIIPQ